MYLIIPTTLVCILFWPAIPTSPFNFFNCSYTVPLTDNLTNEYEWHACSVALLVSQFPATACTRLECTRSCGHTQVLETRRQKNLANLEASHSFTASLRWTSLLIKSFRKLSCLGGWQCSWSRSWVLETHHEKIQILGSLSIHSESYTTSLRSANSPAVIKKYDKRANCLLSWFYLVYAIIVPRPIRTRGCMRICARVRVLALSRRGHILHPRVNVQAARVTSSLLALVCQVTRDRYCTGRQYIHVPQLVY